MILHTNGERRNMEGTKRKSKKFNNEGKENNKTMEAGKERMA